MNGKSGRFILFSAHKTLFLGTTFALHILLNHYDYLEDQRENIIYLRNDMDRE